MINAAWLQNKQHYLLKKNDNKPYLINPYTTVDALVKRLLGIQTNFIWAGLNEPIKVENLILKVEKTAKILVITITNEGKSVFLLNAGNLDNYFQLFNQAVQLPLRMDAVTLVKPNETKSVVLSFEAVGDILVFRFGREEVFVEL